MNALSQIIGVFFIIILLALISSVLFDIRKILENRIITEIKDVFEEKEKKPTISEINRKEDIVGILEDIHRNLESSLRPTISKESSMSLVVNSTRNLNLAISLLKFNIKMERK